MLLPRTSVGLARAANAAKALTFIYLFFYASIGTSNRDGWGLN